MIADLLKDRKRPKASDDVGKLLPALFRDSAPALFVRSREAASSLRASGMGHFCPRRFFFESVLYPGQMLVDEAKKDSLVDFFMMDIGTHVHTVVQDQILGPLGVLRGTWRCASCGWQTATDGSYLPDHVPVGGCCERPDYRYVERHVVCPLTGIPGHLDGIICLNRLRAAASGTPPGLLREVAEEDLALFELKTSASTVRRAEDLPKYYRMQQTLYQSGTGIPQTLFLYMHRAYCQFSSFLYRAEKTLMNEIRETVDMVRACVDGGVVPVEETRVCLTKRAAKDCPFSARCFAADPLDVKYDKEDRVRCIHVDESTDGPPALFA